MIEKKIADTVREVMALSKRLKPLVKQWNKIAYKQLTQHPGATLGTNEYGFAWAVSDFSMELEEALAQLNEAVREEKNMLHILRVLAKEKEIAEREKRKSKAAR